jgi:glycosyltransferase involved in cell wall biosynthesis
MPRNDVAIYAPYASQLYERDATVSGGAELQTVMLATQLASRGLRCGHIVLPLDVARTDLTDGLEIVQRAPFGGGRKPLGKGVEMRRVWQAFEDADAQVYVFRGGWPALGVAAAFCRRRGRRLVFASASDRNFVSHARGVKRLDYGIYRYGARRADAIVAQTASQAKLAREAFPRVEPIVEVPSFAEPAELSTAAPEAFLWTGRLIEYKNPDAYVELARAVPEARFWMIPKFVDEDPERGRLVEQAARELPNLELLDARPRADLMKLVDRSVAIVNTSPREGMPNLFLEGWARGIPALTLEFDPDGRIAEHGLGVAAGGSIERFAAGARELWEGRGGREALSQRSRAYVVRTHGYESVTARWVELLEEVR